MPSQKIRTLSRRGFSYLFLAVTAALCVYPALWVVMSSLRPGDSLFSESLLPSRITADHYRELFTRFPFMQWYANTLKISVASTVIGSMLVLITGYVFSMFRFAGRKNVMNMLLVLGLFPGFMSMIAIYILLNQMNLLNTHLAVIIVSSAGRRCFSCSRKATSTRSREASSKRPGSTGQGISGPLRAS